MATKPSKHDPIVLLVIGTSLLMGAGSVVFTLLPAMQDKVGFPTWGFGLIAGVFFASSLVAQLVLSRFADRGRGKALLTTAIVLAISSLVWLAFGDSLFELTLARGLGGLATGCWAPAARALAIAHDPERAGTRLGYIAVGDTSGLVVGPLFGAFLASAFSIETSFLVFASLILLLSPVVFMSAIPADRSLSAAPRSGVKPGTLIRQRPVQQATLLAVALFLPVGLYETVWGKHISNLGGSTHIIALSVAFYGLPYMLVAPLGGRLGDRIGSIRVALLGAAGIVIVTAITGVPRNYWILLLIGVVEAAISAVAYTNALAAMARACRPEEQATGQGLAGAASIAGAGLMALLAGPIFAIAGPVVAFATASGLVAVGAAAAYRLDPSAFSAKGRIEPAVAAGEPATDRG
ncbi:MAG: MFS transporter [Acidimicrobiales bacterium]